MRRSLLVSLPALVLASLTACGADPPPPPQPPAPPPPPVATTPPAETAKPAEAPKPSLADMQKLGLKTAGEALNGHDPKKFASVYAKDGGILVAGLNEVHGQDAIEQNMKEWFETFSNVKFGFSRVWVKHDQMAIEWVINGKHAGELFGVKGTEQDIGHYGFSIVSFTPDGKVGQERRYGDLGTVMTQVGAAKAKPRPVPSVPAMPEMIVAKGAPEEDKSLDVAKQVLAALESKKEADYLKLVSDDMEHDGLFHLETAKGKDAAKKFFKAFTTAFPDAKFDVKWGMSNNDFAILETVMTATHKGDLGKIKATKRPVSLHLVDVLKVKDGKVARAWTFQNSLEMQTQLGLFEVKAANPPASQAGAGKPAAPAKPAPKK